MMIALLLHASDALEQPSDSIVDLYDKIAKYGSLVKATSFLSATQTKLKDINTVRMVSYQGLYNE
jgi:hypothetical protein